MNHREDSCLFGKGARVILLLIFLSLVNFTVFSQQIISRNVADYTNGSVSSLCISAPSSGCIIALPPAKYGESYAFTIPILSSILRSDVNFIFKQKSPCSEEAISFTSDGKIEIQSAIGCKPLSNNFIEIQLKAESKSLIDSIKLLLPILREQVNVVLALDMSGSMTLPVIGGVEPKWEVLKKSIELFTQKMEVFKQEGDQIGITYFSNKIVQLERPNGSYFIDVSDESATVRSNSAIRSDIDARVPSEGTAIGKGLLNAKQKLNDNNQINTQKKVLLFTDGYQNIEPLINTDGVVLSAGGELLNNGPCNPLDSIRYYTIGMGGANLISEMLGKIAQASGGVALLTTPGLTGEDFDYFFQNQFVNMLEGSPQVVVKKTGTLSASGTKFSFPINANVSKIYFELTCSKADGIDFKLEKGGRDLTSVAKFTSGSFNKSLSLSLPVNTPDPVQVEGDWELTVTGKSPEKFSVVCYVEDHFLSISCKPKKSVFTIGEKVMLVANLSFAGKPLTGDENKVQVTIVKPGDDIGDVLAKTNIILKDSLNDITSGADNKLFNILKDQFIVKKLDPSSHTIELEDTGNGIFTGEYDNTKLSGVYQLIFTVNGEVKGFGKFERQKHFSTIFKFGKINPNKSNLKAILHTSKDKRPSTATISFKPCNEFGYYLGPGYLSAIKLSVDENQGTVTSKKDNLDGSYTFIISDIPQNTKPDLRLMVMEETLYLGKFPSPSLYLWQFLVLAVLIIALIVRYIFAHTGLKLLRLVLWILLISWVLIMLLQRLGFISM